MAEILQRTGSCGLAENQTNLDIAQLEQAGIANADALPNSKFHPSCMDGGVKRAAVSPHQLVLIEDSPVQKSMKQFATCGCWLHLVRVSRRRRSPDIVHAKDVSLVIGRDP